MKKCIALSVSIVLAAVMCSGAWGDVPIDETHFPDEVFRAFISTRDYDKDGVLSDIEIANINTILLYGNIGYAVSSLKGIEYLTALTDLRCNNGSLTELDLSHNTALEKLDCSGHNIRVLDLTHNTHLKSIRCTDNHMTSLVLGSLPELTELSCRL